MRFLIAWLQASRLPSQAYIFFPLLFGQGLYAWQGGKPRWDLGIWVHLYGLLIQLFIVYANDIADQATDRANQTFNLFSGGSRVLVEGRLRPHDLGAGVAVTMLASLGVVAILSGIDQRPWWWLGLALSWSLLWAYSYPPLRLSYRGGGEWLQALGVGGLLPVLGYYTHAGSLAQFPWGAILSLLPLQWAAAMATSIPDEPSDRAANKRTFVVRWGERRVKWLIVGLYAVSLLGVFWLGGLHFSLMTWIAVLGLPLGLLAALPALISQAPAGSRRSNLFVALAVGLAVSTLAGLAFATFFSSPAG